ncbi:hypothetical protein [uncultured Roseibium sp.]|uniref:hypothetical protein n=1 Tax=uncultured Roseibium sp. TaxID=1936171 RepID=UPI00263688D8|nr:hypothetical protein [uncultured Roseibium sp.]
MSDHNLSTLDDAILGAKWHSNQVQQHAVAAYYVGLHSKDSQEHQIQHLLSSFDKLSAEVARIRAELAAQDTEEAA